MPPSILGIISLFGIPEFRVVHEVVYSQGEGGEPGPAPQGSHGAGPQPQQPAGGETRVDGVVEVVLAAVALDDALRAGEHEPDGREGLGLAHDAALHVHERLAGCHDLVRVVRRHRGGEQAHEASKGPADHEAHGALEDAGLHDAGHHELLLALDAGRTPDLGHEERRCQPGVVGADQVGRDLVELLLRETGGRGRRGIGGRHSCFL